MMAALKEQLRDQSIRDIKVVNIAEAAGVTPAAFYQYFTGVEDAMLALADEMVIDARALTDLMTGDWQSNSEGLTLRAVEGFLSFWQRHEPVLRVIELGIDEHDTRFNRVRMAMLNEPTLALSFVIANFKAAGKQPEHVEPRALAAALVAVLVHVSSRLWLYEAWGLERGDLEAAMADILHTMVTRSNVE